MTLLSLIRSETRKALSVRSFPLLLLAVAAVPVVTVLDPGSDAATWRKPFDEQIFVLFTGLLTRVLILVAGVRLVADEFRYGTIVPTLLVSPRRGRVLTAKLILAAALGAAASAAAFVTMTAAAAAAARSAGAELVVGDEGVRVAIGLVAMGALWAVIGVGLGAVLRNQVAATVGGAVWLMGAEDALRGAFGDLARFLPGQAGLAAFLAPGSRAVVVAGLTVVAYATAFALAGAVAMRRDVS